MSDLAKKMSGMRKQFQYKLRISDQLRRAIADAAMVKGVSANREMISRLEGSFDQASIRDAFAIAALQGILANSFSAERDGASVTTIAYSAYRYAEAMLEERDR